MSNFYDSQIQNRNFLSPVGFKFSLAKKEKVEFLSNTAQIPGINFGTALQGTPFRMLDVPGTELLFEDFTLSFLVDEDLKNYMIIHNWMYGLGFPESFKQFNDQVTDPNTGQKDDILQYCDGTLHVLNSNYRSTAMVKFKDLFPISLTPLQFTASDNDINYFTAEASFRYTYYDILDPKGDPL